jgi:hypothetical protein
MPSSDSETYDFDRRRQVPPRLMPRHPFSTFLLAALFLPAAMFAQTPPCTAPLSEQQLTDLVKNRVPELRLREFVSACGLSFVWSEEIGNHLQGAGLSAELAALVRQAAKTTRIPVAPAPPAPTAESKDQLEIAYWLSIKDETDPQFFQLYLKKFPGGVFAEIARIRIKTASNMAAAPAAASPGPAPPPAKSAASPTDELTFAATHKHLVGPGCMGDLHLTRKGLTFSGSAPLDRDHDFQFDKNEITSYGVCATDNVYGVCLKVGRKNYSFSFPEATMFVDNAKALWEK